MTKISFKFLLTGWMLNVMGAAALSRFMPGLAMVAFGIAFICFIESARRR